MSFEGYNQVLCGNGHLHYVDVYEFEKYFPREFGGSPENITLCQCPHCGTNAVWTNQVDTTNGSWDFVLNGKSIFIEDYDDTESFSDGMYDYEQDIAKATPIRIDGYIELEVISEDPPKIYKLPLIGGRKR